MIQLSFHTYDLPREGYEPGAHFYHKGAKYIIKSHKKNFIGARCLIEAINADTGNTALLFADEIVA